MIKAILTTTISLLLFLDLAGQSIERKVIASAGAYFEGSDLIVSSTLGETFTSPLTAYDLLLTQGFQQIEVPDPFLKIFIKAYIQGFYIANGLMNSPYVNNGITTDPTVCDKIAVCLVDQVTHVAVECANTMLDVNGNASIHVTTPGTYYISLSHQNALQTWSSMPISITDSVLYDFTTAAGKAYGNNMVEVENGVWALWSGDTNQDYLIDSTDYSAIENDVVAFAFGYLSTDLTGDGVVESADYSLIDNNAQLFLSSVHP